MVISNNKDDSRVDHVKFVSYTGKYPTLCSGNLTLLIDGENVEFDGIKDRFWESGGCVFAILETYIVMNGLYV